jgi:hypothetical protein
MCVRNVVHIATAHRHGERRRVEQVNRRLRRIEGVHCIARNTFIFASWFRWTTTEPYDYWKSAIEPELKAAPEAR